VNLLYRNTPEITQVSMNLDYHRWKVYRGH
jgi:hypothetical protein